MAHRPIMTGLLKAHDEVRYPLVPPITPEHRLHFVAPYPERIVVTSTLAEIVVKNVSDHASFFLVSVLPPQAVKAVGTLGGLAMQLFQHVKRVPAKAGKDGA